MSDITIKIMTTDDEAALWVFKENRKVFRGPRIRVTMG